MKIAIVVPTRNEPERKEFLDFARKQIERQTRKPDFLFIIDEPGQPGKVDLTKRYKIGFQKAKETGADLMVCWEDDDYYVPEYLERISNVWENSKRPDLIGYDRTLYYHLYSQKYLEISHKGRASMMSTAISTKAAIDWPADDYPYTDYYIWTRHQGPKASVSSPDWLSVGIKHGEGLTGGSAHPGDWKGYNKQDVAYSNFSSIVDPEAFDFYRYKAAKKNYVFSKVQMRKTPFLSIVTRYFIDKRPEGQAKNLKSVRDLKSFDYEQIFIGDPVGYGRRAANRSFQYVKDLIDGKYVYLLDDDDFLIDPYFIDKLKGAASDSPEVIFFRMKILTGDGDEIYPKPESWRNPPARGRIGGSCFAVRTDVFKKHIAKFDAESFGDFLFIDQVYRKTKNHVWIDERFAETGKVSRGAVE